MKKKLMYIVTRLEPGGTLEAILALSEGLASKYEFTLLLGTATTDIERVRSSAVNHGYKVVFVDALVREISLFKDLNAYFAIKKAVKKLKPDIIHTHTSKAGFIGRLAGKNAGVNSIIHTPHGHIFYGYFGSLKTRIFIFLEKLAAKYCKKIIVFTEAEKNDNLKLKIGRNEQYVVIPNGIMTGKYVLQGFDPGKKRKELGIPEGKRVVGVVGRLAPVKGHAAFLDAFKIVREKIPEAFALIAGDGELKEALIKKTADMGLSGSVLFIGHRNDVPEILAVCDCLALPSLNEGFGLAVIEAWAAGKPVAVFAVGGVPEIIKDGVTGYLAAPGDISGLAGKISILLLDKTAASKLAKAGKSEAENYTIDKMIERTEKVYETL